MQAENKNGKNFTALVDKEVNRIEKNNDGKQQQEGQGVKVANSSNASQADRFPPEKGFATSHQQAKEDKGVHNIMSI